MYSIQSPTKRDIQNTRVLVFIVNTLMLKILSIKPEYVKKHGCDTSIYFIYN